MKLIKYNVVLVFLIKVTITVIAVKLQEPFFYHCGLFLLLVIWELELTVKQCNLQSLLSAIHILRVSHRHCALLKFTYLLTEISYENVFPWCWIFLCDGSSGCDTIAASLADQQLKSLGLV